MSGIAIAAEHLGKKYSIRHKQTERYTALRDVITEKFVTPWRSVFTGSNGRSRVDDGRVGPYRAQDLPTTEEFWALKDVSFEIGTGEVVGIIGRNGAGKSTLLKVLSRITEPSRGSLRIRGRLASLLEVGTGFHPELTGRENIYLNGALLGMTRDEIKRRFDEIVSFAEVERFLDTPVKRYSSGMYVRLAFAVAAHLEPEILIVDEVLAVGDAHFQKKCLGKLKEVGTEGRTVLFVSHNMQTISSICKTGILLDGGQVKYIGSAERAVNEYLSTSYGKGSARSWGSTVAAPGNDVVRLLSVRAINASGEPAENFDITEPIGIEMEYEVFEEGHILWFGHNLYDGHGINIFDTHSTTSEWYDRPHPAGRFASVAWIPGNLLSEGVVLVGCAIFNHDVHVIHFHERDVIVFNVIDYLDKNSARGRSTGAFPGVVRPMLEWETRRLSPEPDQRIAVPAGPVRSLLAR